MLANSRCAGSWEPTKYLYIISKSTDPIPVTGSQPTETLSPSAQHLELPTHPLSDEVMSLMNDAFLLWLEYSAGLRKPRAEAPAFCLAMFIRDTMSLNRYAEVRGLIRHSLLLSDTCK